MDPGLSDEGAETSFGYFIGDQYAARTLPHAGLLGRHPAADDAVSSAPMSRIEMNCSIRSTPCNKMESMQSRIDQLEAERQQTTATEPTTTSAPVVTSTAPGDGYRPIRFFDASGVNMTFDPREGLNLRSDDGAFLLHPGVLFQGAGDYDGHHTNVAATVEFELTGSYKDLSFNFTGYTNSMDGLKWEWEYAQYVPAQFLGEP